MTAQELIDEVSASLGNRTDITTARYLTWLNWAQYDLCGFHEKRLFPSKRFHELEGDYIFSSAPITDTAQGGAAASIILAAVSSAVDDYYNSTVIKITSGTGSGQQRLIVDYVGATRVATVDQDWDTEPDNTSVYETYRYRWHLSTDIGLDPKENVWIVEAIEQLESGSNLEQKEWGNVALGKKWSASLGAPTTFARRGSYIVFNTAVNSTTWYRLLTYNFPTRLVATALDTEPILADFIHEAIAAGAIYRGFAKLMEPERAASAKSEYISIARNKLGTMQLEKMITKTGMKMRFS